MKYLFLLSFLLLSFELHSQTIRTIARLPELLSESSGIEKNGSRSIWSFNDSGGKAKLYLIDITGKLQKTLSIKNAKNRDWEDIAKDSEGNLYIADIGNNNNDSKNLKIYKLPNPEKLKSKSIKAKTISFRYEDQKAFPPKKPVLNFDAETLFWFNDYLYICTKNRTKPFDGKTYLYRLPDKPGTHKAKKIGQFDTGGRGDMTDHWITAGDISPNGSKLALLSSAKVWIFYNYKKDDFFKGKRLLITLPHKTQKEAICFIDEKTLYITDEEWKDRTGRNLYSLELPF